MTMLRSGIRYVLLVGLSAAGYFGITALLHEVFDVRVEIAFAVALCTVFVTNFLGMRYFVYAGRHGRIGGQFVAFLFTSLGFRGSEYACFFVLHRLLATHYLVAIALTTGTFFVVKFFFYRYFVFRTKPHAAGEESPTEQVLEQIADSPF